MALAMLYEGGTRNGAQGMGRRGDECARCYGGRLTRTVAPPSLGKTLLVCDVCGRRYDPMN